MEYFEIKYEIIKECLGKLISKVLIMGSLCAIGVLSYFFQFASIDVVSIPIPREIAGSVLLIVFAYLELSIYKKYSTIKALYESIMEYDLRSKMKLYLNSYPSMLNPFAEIEDKNGSHLFDLFGSGINEFFFYTGVNISLKYISSETYFYTSTIVVVLIIFHLLFRFDFVMAERRALELLSPKLYKIKNLFAFLFALFPFIVSLIFELHKP